ncbi:LPS export ABC transporter protein LptC [Sediminitomix flava]|uniref:LPS export ABC transporter protein LptC n=2 Tax=Sediminitomix flava TaxID=379075 RepID=A0A315ZJQ9_SEDFL|nr:LPS export ABC transporter protein LptC [Sediminitomix flava]
MRSTQKKFGLELINRALKKTILFVTALVGLFACSESRKANNEVIELGDNVPESTSWNVETLYNENEELQMRMQARAQYSYATGNRRYPEGIKIITYTPEGDVESTMIADSALYISDSSLYIAYSNVVLVDEVKEQTLETDTLNYFEKTGDITTDARVKIIKDGEITTGKGMRANRSDPDDYELLDIEGTVYIDEDE